MPELPDVELFKKYLSATALHKKIAEVEVLEPKVLKDTSVSGLRKALKNKVFSNADRYGKNLFVKTSGRYLLRLHFGMTGYLQYFKDQDDEVRHIRVLFCFTDGYNLAYICQRLLGEVSLEESIEDFVERNRLGPDASEISLEEFKKAAVGKRGAIKSLLMDQSKIAGLGNIYADEVLFQSRVHPKSNAKSLEESNIRNIYRNINKVLAYAVKKRANPELFGKSYLLPYREKEGECPRCHTAIRQIKVSGRTSYFCPECQKLKG